MQMGIDLSIIDALKSNGFEFIENYFRGIKTYWGFNKERSIEITININEVPDEETENLKSI